jgi:hypothetical protein
MNASRVSVLLASIMAAPTGFAATVSNTEIKMVMIERQHGAKVFLTTMVAKTANSPTCHTNASWAFVLPLTTDTDKAIYSALLAAKSAGRKVNLVGAGECNTHAAIETLTRVDVL